MARRPDAEAGGRLRIHFSKLGDSSSKTVAWNSELPPLVAANSSAVPISSFSNVVEAKDRNPVHQLQHMLVNCQNAIMGGIGVALRELQGGNVNPTRLGTISWPKDESLQRVSSQASVADEPGALASRPSRRSLRDGKLGPSRVTLVSYAPQRGTYAYDALQRRWKVRSSFTENGLVSIRSPSCGLVAQATPGQCCLIVFAIFSTSSAVLPLPVFPRATSMSCLQGFAKNSFVKFG